MFKLVKMFFGIINNVFVATYKVSQSFEDVADVVVKTTDTINSGLDHSLNIMENKMKEEFGDDCQAVKELNERKARRKQRLEELLKDEESN